MSKQESRSPPLFLVIASITAFLLASDATATNGYFSHGYGTQTKALRGAGAALPLNALAAATNPAAMAFLGNRYDLGIALFSPHCEYTVTGDLSGMGFGLAPGTADSDTKPFAIPALGTNWMMDPNSSI